MLVHNNHLPLRLFGAVLLLALAIFPAAAHQAESTQPVAINSSLVTATVPVAVTRAELMVTGCVDSAWWAAAEKVARASSKAAPRSWRRQRLL